VCSAVRCTADMVKLRSMLSWAAVCCSVCGSVCCGASLPRLTAALYHPGNACEALRHTATHCTATIILATYATHCDTLQLTALQQTATHCTVTHCTVTHCTTTLRFSNNFHGCTMTCCCVCVCLKRHTHAYPIPCLVTTGHCRVGGCLVSGKCV